MVGCRKFTIPADPRRAVTRNMEPHIIWRKNPKKSNIRREKTSKFPRRNAFRSSRARHISMPPSTLMTCPVT